MKNGVFQRPPRLPRSLALLAALQLFLGFAASLVPLLAAGGSRAILLLGLPASLLFPLLWLSRPGLHAGRELRGRFRLFTRLYLLPAAALLATATVRTRRCEIADGLAMLLAGHLPGMAVSFALVELARTVAAPRLLYGCGWILGNLLAAFTFLTQPSLRTGNPFAGMLLSSLYERPRVLTPLAMGFAAESLLLAATLLALAGRSRRPGSRARVAGPALALALLHAGGPILGTRIDRATLLAELPHVAEAEGTTSRISRLVPTDARPWLALDARFAWGRALRQLGLAGDRAPRPLLFWYDGSGQSRELTGAGHRFTHPWDAEAHLIASSFPAPALEHELAHLAAAPVAENILGVPGRLGGFWMNPAMTEGLAVAVAWGEDPISAHETARIALDAGRLPPLAELFHPTGFLTHNLDVAYDVSGSFLRHCLDTEGVAPVRAWVRTLDFEGSFGKPLPVVEDSWRAMLLSLPPLREDTLAIVEAQERPPIASESCDGGRRAQDLQQARAALAFDEADRLYEDEVARGEPRAFVAMWRDRAWRARYRLALPDRVPDGLGALDRERLALLAALVAWAREGGAAAERVFAALPERMRLSAEVVAARTLARDGYGIDEYRPPPDVDAEAALDRLWQRDRHPVLGFLVARRARARAEWRSLEEVGASISWEGFAFPDDLDGGLPLTTLLWQGEAAFARRSWDRADVAFRAYEERATRSGRRAHAAVWLERSAYFRAHASELTADLPSFPRGARSPRDCPCP